MGSGPASLTKLPADRPSDAATPAANDPSSAVRKVASKAPKVVKDQVAKNKPKTHAHEPRSSAVHFPEALKEPVLRKVQFSTVPRLDTLIDQLYDTYKTDYFPGELVIASLEDSKHEALIREKTKLVAMTFPDGFQRPASSRYGIELCEKEGDGTEQIRQIVDESRLMRERGSFTKVMLKSFLKSAITRENWIGAPWLVNAASALQYRLPTAVPAHLQYANQKRASNMATVDPTNSVAASQTDVGDAAHSAKVVVEDLNLPATSKTRPKLSYELAVGGPLVQLFLETWAFFNVFLEVLNLDSFTLDDFGDALQTHDPCELVDETFCSLLKALKENGLVSVKKTATPSGEGSSDSVDEGTASPEPGGIDDLIGDWRRELSVCNFARGRYVVIIMGLADQLSREPQNAFCLDILDALQRPTFDKAKLPLKFRALAPDLKVQLLAAIIDMMWQSTLVRQYIEDCMDNLTQLRKQRAIANQEKKSKTDAIHQLRLRMRAQFPRFATANGAGGSGGKTHTRTAAKDEDAGDLDTASRGDSSDAEMETEDATSQRTEDRKPESERRSSNRLTERAMNQEPDDSATDTRTDSKEEFQSRADYELEITKIKRSVQRTDEKINKIEEDFRESDAQRLRRLGQDRFYNEYYFLESCGMPVSGLPNCSTSHASYATGRLFVQGPSAYALEDLRHRSELHELDYFHRRRQEEGETSLAPEGWGYYGDADQIVALMAWLNPKGQRESKLRAAIESRVDVITQSMERRMEYLAGEQVIERRSLRHVDTASAELPRFQTWKNTMARRKFGMAHSGEKVASEGSKKRKR